MCNVQESQSNPRTTLIDFNNAACPNSNGRSQVCCEEKDVKKDGKEENSFFDFEEEIFSNVEGPTCDQFSDIGYKCMPYQLCEDYTDDLLFLKQSEFVTIRSELSQQALAEIATCPDLSQVCCHDKKQSCNDFKDIDYRYVCYSKPNCFKKQYFSSSFLLTWGSLAC